MNWIVLSGIAALVGMTWAIRMRPIRRGRAARSAYQKQDFLLSPEERLFFASLKQAVGDQYEIFSRIQARDVMSLRSGSSRANARDGHEAFEAQSFTFVLCHRADLSIACALQLSERSGGGKRSDPSGELLKSICSTAGLPLVIFESDSRYDASEIQSAIASAVRKEPLYLAEVDGRKEPRISGLENFEL